MPAVSVVIPVYNVAPFIERCARALLSQTFQDAEFIFVDDASPDNSIELLRGVLECFPERKVILLSHQKNRGLPAARNTGLAAASGEYVWHCDSDDYPDVLFLERMYEAVMTSGADIAYCDFWLDYGDCRRYMANPTYTAASDMLQQGFLAGLMKYNVWNKLVRRPLYEGISFPEGHANGEDMTVLSLAARADTVVHVPMALYHYMKLNRNAFSNTFSQQHLDDIGYNVGRIWPDLEGVPLEYKMFFKLNVKLPFLLSGRNDQYQLWKTWFPESNEFIGRNLAQPWRTRQVQKWARQGIWPLVWLYAFVVKNIYYGVSLKYIENTIYYSGLLS